MTNSSSFLHKLPQIISPDQRIIFEAIAIAADLIGLSFGNMHAQASETLKRRIGESVQFTFSERLSLISNAWSIVDQTHNICSLIKAAGNNIDMESATELSKIGKTATLLRNKMDHLANNIKNHAKNKTPSPPIFGAITFLTFFDSDIDTTASSPGNIKLRALRSVIVLGSSIQGPLSVQADAAQGFTGINAPCDHFCLQAFGLTLNISDAARKASLFHQDLAKRVEELIKDEAEKLSAKNGAPIKELLMPVAQGTTIVAKATFS